MAIASEQPPTIDSISSCLSQAWAHRIFATKPSVGERRRGGAGNSPRAGIGSDRDAINLK